MAVPVDKSRQHDLAVEIDDVVDAAGIDDARLVHRDDPAGRHRELRRPRRSLVADQDESAAQQGDWLGHATSEGSVTTTLWPGSQVTVTSSPGVNGVAVSMLSR